MHTPIASDLSFEVAQKIAKFRRQHPQLAAAERDSTNQRLYAIDTKPCVFDAFVADRCVAVDEQTWHQARLDRRIAK